MNKKVVLVTGSNRGIGMACIEEFAKAGLNVVINFCHHLEEAYDLKEYIEDNYNVNVLVIKADVSKEDEVNAIVDALEELVNHGLDSISDPFDDRITGELMYVLTHYWSYLIYVFLTNKYL